MRQNKVSLTWVLAIVGLTVLAVSSLAAFTPLGEQMNALAVTIAGDVVCSQCVGTNGDGTNDIKDSSVTNAKIASSAVTSSKISSNAVTTAKLNGGSVTNAKLADSAVTTSKIADGTIKYSDVSKNLIAVEHRDDCNCGGTGWDPNGISSAAFIYDDRITTYSVVSVTPFQTVIDCWTYGGYSDHHVVVRCASSIPNGMAIGYAIFNNPAYGN